MRETSIERAKLGVAAIGLGVGEAHARAYLATGRCELRWLYDVDAARARNLIKQLGAGNEATSIEEILTDPEVDVVSIASYDDAHFDQVVAVLQAGKHVFVEKPLCRTLEELRAVKTAWSAAGEPQLTSNLVLRAAPLFRWLKRAIDAGEFGESYAFDGDYLYGRIEKITDGWRTRVEDYSVMLGGGVHLVDLMLWLTGQRPVAVSAVGVRICTRGTAFQYPDHVSATFQFASGLIGRITANFGCVHPHQHVVRVFGTRGTFLYDDQGPRLSRGRDPSVPPQRLELSARPSSKGDLIPWFIEGVLGDKDRRGFTQHEFDVISVCSAADRALIAGRPIEVEYA